MGSDHLYQVRMDAPQDHENGFNQVYATEYAATLFAVTGVRRGARYRNPSPSPPRYLVAYEIDSPGSS